MKTDLPILIAHAESDSALAGILSDALFRRGYRAHYSGTVLVGDSIVEDSSKLLHAGAPILLCGTITALGTGWAHRLVNAARRLGCPIYGVQMERECYMDMLMLDLTYSKYWQDPSRSIDQIVTAIREHFNDPDAPSPTDNQHESAYISALGRHCEVIDLSNLPDNDRNLATRQIEIRNLYVPTRLKPVAPDSDTLSDIDFDAMEQQRLRERLVNGAQGGAPDEANRFSLGSRLTHSHSLVILGDPGSGKTTLTKWLAASYLYRFFHVDRLAELPDTEDLPDKSWLPILIRCRDLPFQEQAVFLDTMLTASFQRFELPTSMTNPLLKTLEARMFAGTALLIVDGLDEISDVGTRIRVVDQIENIRLACPDSGIVVTSRIVGYKEISKRIGRGFGHFTVADLIPAEKDDFARRWSHVTETPDRREPATTELIQDIHSNDRIERLTGNPMLLTTLALVKRRIGRLPHRRADLYADAFDVLLNWRREVDEPLDDREARPQLEYLAYAMCDQSAIQINEDELLSLLEDMRDQYPKLHTIRGRSPEIFLRQLEHRTGIVMESGRIRINGINTSVYEFRHLTFQEYLAARALVDGRFPNRDINRSLAESVEPLAARATERDPFGHSQDSIDDRWWEPVRLVASICNDDYVDDVLRSILTCRSGESSYQGRNRAVLASLCLADEPNCGSALADEILSTLFKHIEAIDCTFGITTALSDALDQLVSSRWRSRLRFHALELMTSGDDDAFVRYGALLGYVDAQSAWGKEENINVLVARFLATRDRDGVSVEYAFVLGQVGNRNTSINWEPVIAKLIEMLADNDRLSLAVSWALRRIVRPLFGLPNRSLPDSVNSLLCQQVLDDRWSSPTSANLVAIIAAPMDAKAETYLQALSHSPENSIRRAVADSVAMFNPTSIIIGIIDQLMTDDSSIVRKALASSLSKLERERSAELLLRLADDPDRDVSDVALREMTHFAHGAFQVGDVEVARKLFGRQARSSPDPDKLNCAAYCEVLCGGVDRARELLVLVPMVFDYSSGPVYEHNRALIEYLGGTTADGIGMMRQVISHLERAPAHFNRQGAICMLLLDESGGCRSVDSCPIDAAVEYNGVRMGILDSREVISSLVSRYPMHADTWRTLEG